MNEVLPACSHSEPSNNPLVSVIVPFLNTEKFIQEAIESVLAQTYSDWELLLVDDGSSDKSTEIAKQYAQHYPDKIHYLEHEGHQNRGASASRNLGIRNAKGSYIAFLDGDDVWLASNLEHLVGTIKLHPEAAMVYGATQWWYSWTENPEDMKRDYVGKLGLQPNTLFEPPGLFIPFFLTQKAVTPCTCSLLIRREVVESIGGFEEDFRYIYTDQVFYAKVCLKAPLFVTSEWGAKYRQHPDSSCAVVEKTGQALSARLRFLNWVEKYLSEQGVEDAEIWRALQKALWSCHHPFLYRLLRNAQYRIWQVKELVKLIAQRTLPVFIHRWLRIQLPGKV